MKKLFFLIALLFIGFLSKAQFSDPVQISAQVMMPYSTNVDDMCGTDEKLQIVLINKDVARPSLTVRLRMTIESQSVKIRTREDMAASFQTFTLNSGIPFTVKGNDLQSYFNADNLDFTGTLSQQDYIQTRNLPEGLYSFCFEAVEINTGLVVSRKTCAFAWMTLSDPPLLNMPTNDNVVAAIGEQNIIFNWTPRHTSNPNTNFNVEYIFYLYETDDFSMSPQQVVNSTGAVFEYNTTATTFLLSSEFILQEGKRYVWRVLAFTSANSAAFRNNGYSEAYSFTYKKDCPEIQSTTVETWGTRAQISWELNSRHIEYQVQYREANNPIAEWFSVTTANNTVAISNLRANTEYEYQVGGACEYGKFTFTTIQKFNTQDSSVTTVPKCGDTSRIPTSVSNTNLVNNLAVGSTFNAGDFAIHVLNVNGGGTSFSGTGYTEVPWLMNMKVAVKFTNVQINATNNQLISGLVETEYDPKAEGITDVDELLDAFIGGYQIGNVVTGETTADYTIGVVVSNTSNFTITTDPGYNSSTGTGGSVHIHIVDDNGMPVSPDIVTDKLPKTVKDSKGNIYEITKSGTVVKVGTAGGQSIISTMNKRNIATDEAVVNFVHIDGEKFALDEFKEEYKNSSAFLKEYERIGDYYVSAKAIAPGATDKICATITLSNTSQVNPSEVQFINGKGTIYTTEYDGGKGRYTIQIVGGPEKDAQEIYAVYKDPKGNDKTLNLGKLLVASYPEVTKKMILVNVDDNDVNIDSIKSVLNRVYNKINIYWSVELDNTKFTNKSWDLDQNNKLEISDNNEFSILTQEMKLLNKAFKFSKGSSFDSEAQYIYCIKYDDSKNSNNSVLGEMPRGKQFGYLFVNNSSLTASNQSKIAHVVAHEVGHGVFTLKHSFDYGCFSEGESEPLNVMDYPAGEALNKHQWDFAHDPSTVFGFAEDETDELYVDFDKDNNQIKLNSPTSFLTPSGQIITLQKDDIVYLYCINYNINNSPSSGGFPNGVLYGFKSGGKKYLFHEEMNGPDYVFKGYYQREVVGTGHSRRERWKGDKPSLATKYSNTTVQTSNSNANIVFIHIGSDVCGQHSIWFLEQSYSYSAQLNEEAPFFLPTYSKSSNANTLQLNAPSTACDCSQGTSLKSHSKNGSLSKIDNPDLKYTEYTGPGETINMTPDGRKEIQNFFKQLYNVTGYKFDLLVYPKNGSSTTKNNVNNDYNSSKANSGNRPIKVEVDSDGNIDYPQDGVFDFDFFGLGMPNSCVTAYVKDKIDSLNNPNAVHKFLAKIYYGIKGIVQCKIGEQATIGSPDGIRFVCGLGYEFIETLDVVALMKGLGELGWSIGKYTFFEAPGQYLDQIKTTALFYKKLVTSPSSITLDEAMKTFIPPPVLKILETVKRIGGYFSTYYGTNGNPWRYGQLTMQIVPLVLTLGEYAPAIIARSTVAAAIEGSSLAIKAANFANRCSKLNRLTNLGFELAMVGTKKVLAPIKNIKSVLNSADALQPLENGVEPILDDVTDLGKVEEFVDDVEEFDKRLAFLQTTEKEFLGSALAKVPTNDGRLYLAVHGDGSQFFVTVNNGTNVAIEMSHRSLATWIEKNYNSYNNIVLLSCGDLSTAQNLINKLGAGKTVTAWDGAVKVFKNGRIEGVGDCRKLVPGGQPDALGKYGTVLSATDKPAACNIPKANGEESILLGVVQGAGNIALDVANATEKQLDDIFAGLQNTPPFKYAPNTLEHKAERWAQYKIEKGAAAKDYSNWSNIYNSNMTKARTAHQAAVDVMASIGWGQREVTVQAGTYTRRMDIADEVAKKGVEVKSYETGRVYATQAIKGELNADKYLIDNDFWQIEWVFKGCEPSQPLRTLLEQAGITIKLVP